MKQFRISTIKINIFILILLFSSISVYAQDVITLRNGTRIEAKVTEITSTELRYKRLEQLDGPTRVVPLADVFAINYEDGTREVINAVQSKEETQVVSQSSNNVSINEAYDSRFYTGFVLGGGGGIIVGLDAIYFVDHNMSYFNQRMGIGIVIRIHAHEHEYLNGGYTCTFSKGSFSLIPSLNYHWKSRNEKFFFPTRIGFGIQSSTIERKNDPYNSDTSGVDPAFFLSAGVAYMTSYFFSLGLNFELCGGFSEASFYGFTFSVNLHYKPR